MVMILVGHDQLHAIDIPGFFGHAETAFFAGNGYITLAQQLQAEGHTVVISTALNQQFSAVFRQKQIHGVAVIQASFFLKGGDGVGFVDTTAGFANQTQTGGEIFFSGDHTEGRGCNGTATGNFDTVRELTIFEEESQSSFLIGGMQNCNSHKKQLLTYSKMEI